MSRCGASNQVFTESMYHGSLAESRINRFIYASLQVFGVKGRFYGRIDTREFTQAIIMKKVSCKS